MTIKPFRQDNTEGYSDETLTQMNDEYDAATKNIIGDDEHSDELRDYEKEKISKKYC